MNTDPKNRTRQRIGRTPALVLFLLLSPPAFGEEASEEDGSEELTEQERKGLEGIELDTIVIKAKRLEPARDSTAFAEILEVKQEATQVTSVNEILSKAVGVQVRRLGGLGSFGAASIRGSTPSQVPVFLDGVLLNAGGFDAVDLGQLSLDALERIEVYRGSTPAHLGTAGIGGAVHLRTRQFTEPATEVAASVGSFNSYRLFALRADRFEGPDLRLTALASLHSSQGDFDHLNRNGTLYNPDDDRIQARQNNSHLSGDALLKLDGHLGGWRWTIAENFHAKEQGVAGIESVDTRFASLTTLHNALSVSVSGSLPADSRLTLDASYLLNRQAFDDSKTPHGELGFGRHRTVTTSHAVSSGAHLALPWHEAHQTTARLDLRWESLDLMEEVARVDAGVRSRTRTALAVQHEWTIVDDLAVLPGARIEWLHSAFEGGIWPGSTTPLAPISTDDFPWQVSLGGRWELSPGWSVKANGGRYFRTPTLSELFGYAGAVVGNPELLPEQGVNVDAGLSYLATALGPLDLIRLEVVWFGTWADDLIVFVQNSQDSIRAENVDGARILGLETSLRMEILGHLSLRANYTWQQALAKSDSPTYDGKRLPGRPEHEAYAKLQYEHLAERWGVQLWADMDYAGHNYLDPYNQREDALGRLLFGAGLRLTRQREGLTVTVEVKNLLDTFVLSDSAGTRRPMRDFEAFPLPGRTVLATVHWRY